MSKSDIARRCFEAYRTRQRGMMEDLLADDFRFTSPYDDAIDKADYFRRCWPAGELIRSIDVEEVCEAGDGAFVHYKVVTRDGRQFRNIEFHTVAGDKLRAVDVYFGASYQNGKFLRQQP